jgi:putative salt-induced outer membrane protein YdiY
VARVGAIAMLSWAAVGNGSAFAQVAPGPPPPPVWAGSIGAGLALTNGNADTSNFNLAFKLTYDPMNPHLVTADALHLRGTSEGEDTVNRSAFNVRDEYAWSERTSFFGQLRYLRDTFKTIDYLVAPTGGVLYKLVDLEPTKFTIDAGGGVVWEEDTGLDINTSGAVTLGENFSHKFTPTTTLSQSASGLWKTSDFGDSLYTIGISLAAAMTERLQLKVELLELYKSQPPPGIEKGDVSFITSVVYSF